MALRLHKIGSMLIGRAFPAAFLLYSLASAQDAGQDPAKPPPREPKRIFWIVPNYRTSSSLNTFEPLTPKDKLRMASGDALDPGAFALGAIFAAQSQLSHDNPSFGQGAAGYAHSFGTAYADFMIADYMTEAIFPIMLHQDPRFFRRGTGSGWSRLGYAMGQIFWTHSDSGRGEFNYSELAGNAAGVAISNAYYPDNRDAGGAISKWGLQIGVDMVGNVLKEFWPDVDRKLFHKRQEAPPSAQP